MSELTIKEAFEQALPRHKTRKCVTCGTLMIEESPNTEIYECFNCDAKEYPTMEAFIEGLKELE